MSSAEAMASILKRLSEKEETEKFSCVVSNPPYQAEATRLSGGSDPTTTNVFQHFYEIGLSVSFNSSMIFPGGRWMQRSKGCDSIADLIFATANTIDWYPNGDNRELGKQEKIFPNIGISDGIAIVFSSKQLTSLSLNGKEINRPRNKEILPLQKDFLSIVEKGILFNPLAVNAKKCSVDFFGKRSFWTEKYPETVSEIKDGDPFSKSVKAWLGNEIPGKAKRVKEYYLRWESVDWTPQRKEMLSKWKVVGSQGLVSKAPAFATYHVIDNSHIVGESWMIFGSFDTEIEAINYKRYIESSLGKTMLEASKGAKSAGWGSFLPDLEDYTDNNPHIDWTKPLDPQLYELFGLTEEEIAVVEGRV